MARDRKAKAAVSRGSKAVAEAVGKTKKMTNSEQKTVAPPEVSSDLENLAASIGEPATAEETTASSSSVSLSPLAQDPQLIQDFLVEAREHLSNIEARLLEIEQQTANEETLHSTFRSFHTVKGLAGFLEFQVIQEVAHEVETMLDLARNSKLKLTPSRIDVVLQAGDFIGSWLRHIERFAHGMETHEPKGSEALILKVKAAIESDDPADAETEEQATPREQQEPQMETAATATQVTKRETSLVKVETGKLEYLVDMVGELVIAQSMLRHNPDLAGVRSPRIQRDITQMARVTAEVQKTAMAIRMVPIGHLFRRMTRLVRDLARKSGKRAELEMFGEDVELDRTLVEELADPMVHMIRNSMDHGLETPDERVAKGKPASGTVTLRASHQAGQIHIEISDDGRGLDRTRILKKAIERNVVSADQELSEQEIFQLIFRPGFSTAEKVTDVSGRGVGMDVVRKQVEKLRGRIDIESTPGKGSRFTLKLPLTLAIIDGLVVKVLGERFIVPLFAVREMFKPAPDALFTVEGKGEMALVRGKLLPVIRLARKLRLDGAERDAADGLMIVGESENRLFCLLVDELIGKQEVVIKSLGSVFANVRGVAGGAILGDGRVGLILDIAALAASTARLAAEERVA